MLDPSRAVWRKSTRSGNGGNCVEIADNLAAEYGIVLVRDSKNPTGPALHFTTSEWAAFVTIARTGQFDPT